MTDESLTREVFGDIDVVWRTVLTRLVTHILSQRTTGTGRRGAGLAHLLLFNGFVVLLIGTILTAIEHYAVVILSRDGIGPMNMEAIWHGCLDSRRDRRLWFDDAVDQRVGMGRVRDALDMGADTLVVACPFCILMTAVGIAAEDGKVRVNETAELLAESIDTNESD